MAKKKTAQEQTPWAEQVEKACRDAVSRIPGFTEGTTELEWCQAVSEGLDLYKFGIDARIQELEEDE
jgi:hypothetical protein